jgi:hypothetical protein
VTVVATVVLATAQVSAALALEAGRMNVGRDLVSAVSVRPVPMEDRVPERRVRAAQEREGLVPAASPGNGRSRRVAARVVGHAPTLQAPVPGARVARGESAGRAAASTVSACSAVRRCPAGRVPVVAMIVGRAAAPRVAARAVAVLVVAVLVVAEPGVVPRAVAVPVVVAMIVGRAAAPPVVARAVAVLVVAEPAVVARAVAEPVVVVRVAVVAVAVVRVAVGPTVVVVGAPR